MKKNALNKIVSLGAAFAVFFAAGSIFAAGNEGVNSLQTEIAKVKNELSKQNISAAQKHDFYMTLGRLLKLSGDIEGAASAWQKAAYAEKGKRDDTALLESAACYIAMGEWDKAEANVKIPLLTVRDNKEVFLKSKYLSAQIEAFRNGNEIILYSLADDPEYKNVRASIYLTLWRLTKDDQYRAKLLTEFPESPETRSMLSESRVTDASSAQWFLYPGRESVVLGSSSPGKAPEGYFESAIPPALQVGIFNDLDNALAQSVALKNAGFGAEVFKRGSGDGIYWAVSVPAGANMNTTIAALKKAGYNPFPVY